jgi:hypothetical protein
MANMNQEILPRITLIDADQSNFNFVWNGSFDK